MIARSARCSALALFLVGVVTCSSSVAVGPPIDDGKLPLGTWGGDSAAMIVSDTAMHLHISCTYGDVSGRIAIGANGSFDVVGSYMLRVYPVTVGPAVPARFIGKLDGASVTVTAIVTDTVAKTTVVRGPVTVTYGKDPRLLPCPICRRPVVTMTPRR